MNSIRDEVENVFGSFRKLREKKEGVKVKKNLSKLHNIPKKELVKLLPGEKIYCVYVGHVMGPKCEHCDRDRMYTHTWPDGVITTQECRCSEKHKDIKISTMEITSLERVTEEDDDYAPYYRVGGRLSADVDICGIFMIDLEIFNVYCKGVVKFGEDAFWRSARYQGFCFFDKSDAQACKKFLRNLFFKPKRD